MTDFRTFVNKQERDRRPWLFPPAIEKGKGRGRGHWGHKGRPGKRGGSLPSGMGGVQREALEFIRNAVLSPGLQKPISREAETFLGQTVKERSYTAYRGHGIVKHKAAQYTREEIVMLNNLNAGDEAPDFLLARRKNQYPSYSKKKSVARGYSEGRLSIVLETTIPASSVLVDLENLQALLKESGQTILDQDHFDYFRSDRELLIKGPITAIAYSVKGRLAMPRR